MKRLFLAALILCSPLYVCGSLEGASKSTTSSSKESYPNVDGNPYINKALKKAIKPYLLPLDHPMKSVLDQIFSETRVTRDLQSVMEAGFEVLYIKDTSFIIVARHPEVPGYLFKFYLDSNYKTREGQPSAEWLVKRCKGAKRVRNFLKKNNIQHFTVPDKYIYPLPPIPTDGVQHPIILLVTDMNLVTRDETRVAWMTKVTKEHLDELYIILRNGAGSNFLTSNVPYSKDGKFTFIDTEYPKRTITLTKIKWYIDPKWHPYWNCLLLQKALSE